MTQAGLEAQLTELRDLVSALQRRQEGREKAWGQLARLSRLFTSLFAFAAAGLFLWDAFGNLGPMTHLFVMSMAIQCITASAVVSLLTRALLSSQ
jgi:hypothetical protein